MRRCKKKKLAAKQSIKDRWEYSGTGDDWMWIRENGNLKEIEKWMWM